MCTLEAPKDSVEGGLKRVAGICICNNSTDSDIGYPQMKL